MKFLPHEGLRDMFNDAIRGEDLKFSPSGCLLAVIATNGQICLFSVDCDTLPIRILNSAVVISPGLSAPHGIDFIREDIVVVANRSGWITFHRIPPVRKWVDGMTIPMFGEMNSPWFGDKGQTREVGNRTVVCGPGSVRVCDQELIVCCNYKSTVTSHPFRIRWGRVRTGQGRLLVGEGLDIPDGVARSEDGRHLAVSDHENQRIVIYSDGEASPSCELADPSMGYPHGLCFDSSGRVMIASDAGKRELQIYVTSDRWKSSMSSSSMKMTVVEEDAYSKTRESVPEQARPLEGGVKGIDMNPSGKILAMTCQNQLLRFLELDQAALVNAG